jgi:FixJ family two-component response regulator
MNGLDHMVYVIDDDLRVREAILDLLLSCGFRAALFGSAVEYIGCTKPDVPSCLILDIGLPDINGLDLQSQLAEAQHPPIVFITGHADVPSTVRAMKAGAIDFLPKPFSREQILTAINAAFEHDRRRRAVAVDLNRLRGRYASLTPREREVLPLVVSGLLNKQAAAQLGISLVTFQIHRGHIMRKMVAGSLSELVRVSTKLGIPFQELALLKRKRQRPTELDSANKD